MLIQRIHLPLRKALTFQNREEESMMAIGKFIASSGIPKIMIESGIIAEGSMKRQYNCHYYIESYVDTMPVKSASDSLIGVQSIIDQP